MSAVQTYTDELRVSGIRSGGFGQLPKAVMLDPDLSAESKAIYAYFASYTGGGNTKAFPGRDKIVHDLAVTKDTYYKHFKPLTDNGYISVAQSNGGAGGKGFSHNIYTLEMFPAKYSAIPGNVSDRQLQALQLILEAGDISAAGYGNIPKAVMTDASLPLAAKAVYAYLCVFSGQDFKAAPSKSVATFHLGMSSNSYSKYAKILEQADYISRVQATDGGHFGSVIYSLKQNPGQEKTENTEDSPYTKFSDTVNSYPIIPDTEKQDAVISDTKFSDTNTPRPRSKPENNTISAYQSVRKARTSDGLTDKSEVSVDVVSEIAENKGIPESFLGNPKLIEKTVSFITGSAESSSNSRLHALASESLKEMLVAEGKGTKVNGAYISAKEVLQMVNTALKTEKDEASVSDVIGSAVDRFIKYSGRSTITNPAAYMKTTVLTELRSAVIMAEADKEYAGESSGKLPDSIRKNRN